MEVWLPIVTISIAFASFYYRLLTVSFRFHVLENGEVKFETCYKPTQPDIELFQHKRQSNPSLSLEALYTDCTAHLTIRPRMTKQLRVEISSGAGTKNSF